MIGKPCNCPGGYPTCHECGCRRPPHELREAGTLDGDKLYVCKDEDLCTRLKNRGSK